MCWRLEEIEAVASIISIIGSDTIGENFTHETEGIIGIARYGSSAFMDAHESARVIIGVDESSTIWRSHTCLVSEGIIGIRSRLATAGLTLEIAKSIVDETGLIVVSIAT